MPGAVFAIHQGTTDGQVAATISTDQSGTATAAGLPPGTYCVVETAAPQGFQLQPSYAPSQCLGVGADSSPGQNPTRVTVTDPPSPPPTGELQVVQVDSSGRNVTAPGFTFNARVGSAAGQVVASLTTDQTGTAVAAWLNPSTYCVEQTAVPDGWQMQPAYQPGQCVAVPADSSQGRNPATITVSDPVAPAPSPTPSEEATAPPAESPSPAAIVPLPTSAPSEAGFGPLGLGLVGFGLALLATGLAMVVVGLRRRRTDLGSPPDTWYDSSVS
jgi:hypothetical protein